MFRSSDGGLDSLLSRPRPSWLQLFFQSPFKTLAKTIYRLRRLKSTIPLEPSIKVVCVSDTHNSQPKIPQGDVFIHAGDLTQSGTYGELQATLDWINTLPHKYKIAIAGNHDLLLDPHHEPGKRKMPKGVDWGSISYLQDSSVVLSFDNGRKLKVYGSPWSRKHGNWAFQHEKGTDIYAMTFPEDTDILVTHGPPRFHLDLDGFGDEALLLEMKRVKPKLHVFGHVHEGFGRDALTYDRFEEAYESVCRGGDAVKNLGLMVMQLISGVVFAQPFAKTTLINPAAVGGLRDEVKRMPLDVTI